MRHGTNLMIKKLLTILKKLYKMNMKANRIPLLEEIGDNYVDQENNKNNPAGEMNETPDETEANLLKIAKINNVAKSVVEICEETGYSLDDIINFIKGLAKKEME
jgi:hypothetical protein